MNLALDEFNSGMSNNFDLDFTAVLSGIEFYGVLEFFDHISLLIKN